MMLAVAWGIGGDGVGVGRQRQTIDYGTAYVI